MPRILITGGAGFIGSNLVDYFLEQGFEVVCLDDLSTGYERNICQHINNPKFTFVKGDIRDMQTCILVIKDCDYVCHQAALGSVPRSIEDPAKTNTVNIDGFLNVLIAARDAKVKRFVYAASSSIYGDSKKLPKVEEEIGKPLSPYAVTKYVNELYADVFAKTYGMQCIGLRYFNVFGKRQDPNGAYAAVIPLWVKQLINHERPIINGDGSYSRDFTYIDNVIQANQKAIFIPTEEFIERKIKYYRFEKKKYKDSPDLQTNNIFNNTAIVSEIFNVAYGDNTTLLELFSFLQNNLSKFDSEISNIKPVFGHVRKGDIPHSQASIVKAKTILNYFPEYDAKKGFELAAEWYYNNLLRLNIT